MFWFMLIVAVFIFVPMMFFFFGMGIVLFAFPVFVFGAIGLLFLYWITQTSPDIASLAVGLVTGFVLGILAMWLLFRKLVRDVTGKENGAERPHFRIETPSDD